MKTNTLNEVACVLVILAIFLFVVTVMAEEITLPSHGDKDEQEIIHSLSLSATLFPEALAIWAEMQFMNTPCGCECGQLLIDCDCKPGGMLNGEEH